MCSSVSCLSVCLSVCPSTAGSGRQKPRLPSSARNPSPRPCALLTLLSQYLRKLKGVPGFLAPPPSTGSSPLPGGGGGGGRRGGSHWPLAFGRAVRWLHTAPMGLLDLADQQTARSWWHITSLIPLPLPCALPHSPPSHFPLPSSSSSPTPPLKVTLREQAQEEVGAAQ